MSKKMCLESSITSLSAHVRVSWSLGLFKRVGSWEGQLILDSHCLPHLPRIPRIPVFAKVFRKTE